MFLGKNFYCVNQVAELTSDKFVDFRGVKTLYNVYKVPLCNVTRPTLIETLNHLELPKVASRLCT